LSNSKLTAKLQTNIPIIEVTKEQLATVTETVSADVAYLKALESTLSEWNSKNDTEDYELV